LLLKPKFELQMHVNVDHRNIQAGAYAGGSEGARAPPLNGNRLNTNLLLTFAKTQNNSTHAYIAI